MLEITQYSRFSWARRINGVVVQEDFGFPTEEAARADERNYPPPELSHGLTMRHGEWTYTIWCKVHESTFDIYRSCNYKTYEAVEAAAQEHLEAIKPT